MNKYQEALDGLKNKLPLINGLKEIDLFLIDENINTLQELIDLHEPKEIKVGQVWECVGTTFTGNHEGEAVMICWGMEAKVIDVCDDTAELSLSWTETFVSKDLLNSSCFKLVKDVE